MKDIYFERYYCKVNEYIEEGKSEFLEYTSAAGKITYNFIKRIIPQDFDKDNDYYDIISPYGYGGPIINSCTNYELLIDEFAEYLSNYCAKNNIISEFVRFHPILENNKDFDKIYYLEYSRNTVGTNLKDYTDPFQEEFSKSTRKQIRKALKNGITYEILDSSDSLSKFLEIYYATMNHRDSKEFYYFSEQYFINLISKFKKNIVLVEVKYEGKIISMGFYFKYNNYLHAHLSGTLPEYLSLSPAYIIKYAITEWGKAHGYDLIHHGGGLSNNKDDNLYKFKKRFGQNTEFKFYVGKRIWNREIYNKLCEINNVDVNSEFFPAYRLKN
ncbi:GNAT family N-acetyltransferase [Nosocomiicoccus ampullae]|uniref:GNAT family N-acetyltransferase n=1 Tax=Nosocomiicoccus ampullae TaxID=489910 RepID=UPI0025506895|nr:GNAT family N-acetyltransferase [Nosocomiicoccus ampullae]MDK6864083.1 GNAT family N-acetyltransferase [Nosocomiicoccus ampullae]